MEKLLEDAGIKLSSVASDISGVSGRAMLEALIAGQRDPAELADLAKRRLRSKIPQLTEALTGRFNAHHAFLAQLHLNLIDQHTHAIEELTARIEVVIKPFQGARDLMVTIPGISTKVADVIIAKTGADMSRFLSAGHLASWAGTCPCNDESAGRVKSTSTRPGNPYLKGALGIAAMSAARSHDTYLAAKYRPDRLPTRTDQGPRRRRTRAAHRDLAHAHQRRLLQRARRGLLRPPPAREDQSPRPRPTPQDGLRRHPQPPHRRWVPGNLRVRGPVSGP